MKNAHTLLIIFLIQGGWNEHNMAPQQAMLTVSP